LLLAGLLLILAAGWLRSSAWLREPILRGKETAELEAAIRERPNDALVQYYLAKSYYLQRRFSRARDAYEAAARLDPRSPRARLGLALSLYEMGNLPAARGAFEHALRLDDRSAWAEYMLGKIRWLEGDAKGALPHVRRATELDPRSDQAWYGLAVCYANLRNYNEAIAALRRALARREASAQYHTALGEMLAYRGDAEDGRRHYERALELKPDYGPACALLGNFLLRNAPEPDSLHQAEDLLRRATRLETNRPAEVWFNLGQVYTQQGQFPKAVEALKRSLAIDARDERFYYALANAYRRGGDARNAARTEARFRRISALHVRMQDLEARVVHHPRNAAAHRELAAVYRDLGLAEKAVRAFAAAAALDPRFAATLAREGNPFSAQPAPAAAAPPRDFVFPSPASQQP
jgi:tetratricopeptide (TPR) repeat protein